MHRLSVNYLLLLESSVAGITFTPKREEMLVDRGAHSLLLGRRLAEVEDVRGHECEQKECRDAPGQPGSMPGRKLGLRGRRSRLRPQPVRFRRV
jgi:hypothetical protein